MLVDGGWWIGICTIHCTIHGAALTGTGVVPLEGEHLTGSRFLSSGRGKGLECDAFSRTCVQILV